MPKPPANLDLHALMHRPPAPPAPAPDEERPVPFSNRLRARYKRQLTNLAYWSRHTEQHHLDQAVAAYLARQKPGDLEQPPAPAPA